MTEEQYWDGDVRLVLFYRQADEIRKERTNQELWLQGMYFYDALARISPIFNSNAKKGTKAHPYISEPYPISKEHEKAEQVKKEKTAHDKGLAYMTAYMTQFNERLEQEDGNENRQS